MKFIYQVPSVFPPGRKEEFRPGYCGFTASLDSDFAVLARKTAMNEHTQKRFRAEGNEIVKRFKIKGIFGVNAPYSFIEGSWLLQYAQVPGDACDLGLDDAENFIGEWQSHLRFVEEMKERGESFPAVNYVPHNVDSHQQASALLALWLNWANTASAVLNK